MNIENLSMRDVATIEKLSGLAIDQLGDPGAPKGRLFAAMMYVIKKKEDDTFTFDMALDTPMNDLNDFLGVEDEDEEDSSKS